MPFTGSHPAAVLPLLGTGLPASALVIGSMSPDLPYYFPVTTTWPTHTTAGVVTIDLLLGGAAWLVWHGLLTAPALARAPRLLRGRLTGRVEPGLAGRLSWRQLLLVAVALTVGAITHVAWDEFTHPGRWGPAHLHVLAVDWGPLPGYQWGQYASGLFGAGAEAWWLVRWWRRTPALPVEDQHSSVRAWLVLAAGAVIGGVAGAATARTVRDAAFRGATRGGGAAAGLAVLLALGWHVLRRRDRPAPDLSGNG